MTTIHGEAWGEPPIDPEMTMYLGDWQVQSLRYMQSKEGEYRYATTCLQPNEHVQSIDFIHGLCHRLKAQLETLCLACNIFNHVMSKVDRRDVIHKMALVCSACVTLACKYEEANFWEDTVDLVLQGLPKDTTKTELFGAESVCWGIIQFDLGYPNPLHFIRWTSMYAENANTDLRGVAKFMLECFTLSDAFRTCNSSLIACACTLAARQICQMSPLWSQAHRDVTGYTAENLLPLTRILKLQLDCIEKLQVTTKHMPISTEVIARRHLLDRL